MQKNLNDSLTTIVGNDAVLAGEPAAPYCTDWRGRYSGNALAVVFPSNTGQVVEVVKLCAASQIAIVPQGGNTSLCGASVPLAQGEQIVLNLSRMNLVRAIDPTNYTMTVEAGCKLADVREAAEKNNRFFPLGLTATQKFCEIGGNLSTNAGGINVLRYGNARDLVLGLEVVLPDGRVWNGLRSLRKDNSGYDLKHLFMGAEGTLGIITAAVLKLFPRPQTEATACVAVHDPAVAVALLAHLRANCGDRISAFEIISRSSLDLVFKHIPETREPFTVKHGWIVITQLADVLSAPLDGALRDALRSFGAGYRRIRDFLRTKIMPNAGGYCARTSVRRRNAKASASNTMCRYRSAVSLNSFLGLMPNCNRPSRAFVSLPSGIWAMATSITTSLCRTRNRTRHLCRAGNCREQDRVCGGAGTEWQYQCRTRRRSTQARSLA